MTTGTPTSALALPTLFIAMQVLAMTGAPAAPASSDLVFPGETWQTVPPAQVGMDARKLAEFSDYVGGRGCVIRHGYLVYTWGDASRRGDVASAAKPVYAHFLFRALEDGKIGDLDEPIIKYEPRLAELNPDLGYKDRAITWRHLATQTSCYGVSEPPGTAFDYNDWQMALFWDTLFLRVYGATWEDVDEKVLHPLLTEPLQCQDDPTFMAFGTGDRPGRLAISPRDFARFGLLYLRRGTWRERRLISPEHAFMAVTSPLPNSIPRTRGVAAQMLPDQRSIGSRRIPDDQGDHMGSYSFLWWINGVDREGRRHWPNVPTDTYGAFGHGGPRVLVVIPSLDLVMSWNDARVRGRESENQALRLLTEAVTTPGPVPGQIIVDPNRPRYLWRDGGTPLFMCGPGDPEDFLYRGELLPDGTRDGDQEALIRKLKETGANCIYLMAVRSHGGDGNPTQNPFIAHDPARGLNEKVLQQWEGWFREMDEAGIVIFFIFYDDSARIWDTGDQVGDEEQRFLRALVERFGHHRNLIWCIAEEYQEAFSRERVSRMAAVIRAADRHHHPIAVHKLSGLDFTDFADDPNIDQFAIQYNVTDPDALHEGVVKAWREAAGRYNLNLAEAADWGTGEQGRRKLWACAMGGAYVMVLGMDIASTAPSDLRDCGNLVRFMQSTNFPEMAPHDELGFDGTTYVLARPGHSYILYSREAARELGLRDLPAGTWKLRWFDCASGQWIAESSVELPAGDRIWTRPPGAGAEVAVYITRAG